MTDIMFLHQKKLTDLQHKITKVSSIAEIWECPTTGNKSLHASVTFIPDEVIYTFGSKEILNEPNYLSMQLNEQEHIMLAPEFLQYINHSCNPNVFFNPTDLVVTCLRRIEVGEEMTFFYPSTEWSMAQPFDCDCKSQKCLGRIQGALHLHPAILQTYKLSNYIKQKLEIL